jgi:hypothetical protein
VIVLNHPAVTERVVIGLQNGSTLIRTLSAEAYQMIRAAIQRLVDDVLHPATVAFARKVRVRAPAVFDAASTEFNNIMEIPRELSDIFCGVLYSIWNARTLIGTPANTGDREGAEREAGGGGLALVRCCRSTAAGKQCKRRRWQRDPEYDCNGHNGRR